MDDIGVLKAFLETLECRWARLAQGDSPHSNEQARQALSSAYLRLAKDLNKLDAWEECLAASRKAASTDPENLDAVFFLLTRLEQLNRIDEAWTVLCAQESRHRDPYASCAELYLIKACLEYRRGKLETARSMFEEFIEKERGSKFATLAYGWLGKTLDRLGLYDAAMEAANRYNSLADTYPKPPDTLKRSRQWQTGIETSLNWYRRQSSLGWRQAASFDSDASPILLVGFPRSGTTLLERILDTHSALRAVDERPTLDGIEERFFGNEEKLSCLRNLDTDAVEACRQTYWANVSRFVERHAGDGIRVVDKYPLHIVHLDIYARLFPDVRIIVALRDPRDSVLSNYFQMFGLNQAMVANLDLNTSAKQYAKVMELYQLFKSIMPGNIHEIRYENVVTNFRREISDLLDFLGLEWEGGLERFYETATQSWIRTPSYEQVIKPLYANAIGRWKNYAHYLDEINPILHPFVESFGYSHQAQDR